MVAIADVLIVMGIGSILATIVGATLKYIFDKRKEMTRYYIDMSKRMIDTLHDYIKRLSGISS